MRKNHKFVEIQSGPSNAMGLLGFISGKPEKVQNFKYSNMKGIFLLVLGSLWIVNEAWGQYPALAEAALQIKDPTILYDPTYFRIAYPNGDVPADRGVCTDVVVRAYRKLGVDLQKEVHEDMKANFAKYPKSWGLTRPDANIDHRRVPNLMTFFSRHGEVLQISKNSEDYKQGDIVCWDLGGGILHIGIVSNVASKERSTDLPGRLLMMHNIGRGQILENCLFAWKIIGHYRYKKQG